MYHIPMALQCIYGPNDEGDENRYGKEGSEIPGGGERLVITRSLLCK